ncbi:piggyBac transposable element-derived protein 2-like [Schistocerca piceifrons]|uniref:piggyBac transposable element-derived protein 2-like n=1 Tax=Schistocerca piceifrons TaxID=274613 RepID=UPI001F5F43DB|nr:piggyBac transposable element-derived protein 2-like [Schistocerca piceifrons]
MSRKSQEEMLMELLEIPLSSDDDLECFSDDSIQDEAYVAPESVDCDSDSSDEESQVPVIRTEDVSGTRQSDVIMKESTSQLSDNALKLPCSSKNVTKNSRSVVWKDKQLIIPELQSKFHGNTSLPEEVINLNTPYQFFKHIFPCKLFDLIVEESHRYSVQCNPDRPIDLSCDDIKKFIGICLVMSIVHVPNTRDYWGEVTGTHLIKTTMTVNQYEQIRKFLHFNDNSAMIPRGEKGHDRLFKIRPIIELMRSRFQTIPVEECVSVDEQICSTKARSYLKQYMPNKPHKYGYKLFVISGISGYAHDFEIFTGDENEPEKRVTGEEDLGASANVVVRLSRILPRNMNHKLYCDNYYTSLPLLVWLHKQGIYSLGTVRRNRVPDCKLPSEAELKKMARGASVERVATVDGVDISNVVWKDNKSVMLLSTLAGQQPIHEAGRYDKKTKSRITIPCPQIIKLYNKHMGGVDLLDSIMGRHKILVKSRKWYIRLFYHLLDMGVVNSWLLYRRVAETKGIRRTMKLSEFRMEIAHCLCRSGQTSAKRGRPSNELENQIQAKKTKGPTAHVPPQDVRLDQVGHLPSYLQVKNLLFPGENLPQKVQSSHMFVGRLFTFS